MVTFCSLKAYPVLLCPYVCHTILAGKYRVCSLRVCAPERGGRRFLSPLRQVLSLSPKYRSYRQPPPPLLCLPFGSRVDVASEKNPPPCRTNGTGSRHLPRYDFFFVRTDVVHVPFY